MRVLLTRCFAPFCLLAFALFADRSNAQTQTSIALIDAFAACTSQAIEEQTIEMAPSYDALLFHCQGQEAAELILEFVRVRRPAEDIEVTESDGSVWRYVGIATIPHPTGQFNNLGLTCKIALRNPDGTDAEARSRCTLGMPTVHSPSR